LQVTFSIYNEKDARVISQFNKHAVKNNDLKKYLQRETLQKYSDGKLMMKTIKITEWIPE